MSEIINYATFLIVTLLQVIRLTWYFVIFVPNFDLKSNGYIDIAEIATSSNTIANLMGLVTILLFVSIIKYVIFWVSDVALQVEAISISFNKTLLFSAVSLCTLMGFVTFFFFQYGNEVFLFSRYTYTLTSVMQIFLGSWNVGQDFEPYSPLLFMLVCISGFLLWKQVLWYTLVVNVSWGLKAARSKIVKKQPKNEEEEEG